MKQRYSAKQKGVIYPNSKPFLGDLDAVESTAVKQNKQVSLNTHLAGSVGKTLNLVSQTGCTV